MLKKEFTTYWISEDVATESSEPLCEFFCQYGKEQGNTFYEAMVPCDIKNKDLIAFQGKKTKVTIEVIE